MRPYSYFLEDLIHNTPESRVNLGGSTPAFPFDASYFKDVHFKLDPPRMLPEHLRLRSLTAQRMHVKDDNILFTPGSSQGLTQVLAAITEVGDSILIESPNYDPFKYQPEFLGLKNHFFKRTGDELADHKNIHEQKKAISDIKVLLISNTHTPLGRTYSKEFLLKLCSEFEWVIVDEDFYPLFTDGSITAVPGLDTPNLITLQSFNKAMGLLFIRLGFVRAHSDVISKVDNMGTLFHIDVPSPSLQIGCYAMERWDEITGQILKNMQPKQKQFQNLIKDFPGHFAHDFKHGFFNFVKCPKGFDSSEDFSQKFLKETDIYIRPGAHFELPDWLRFHLFMSDDDIKLFILSLRKFLKA